MHIITSVNKRTKVCNVIGVFSDEQEDQCEAMMEKLITIVRESSGFMIQKHYRKENLPNYQFFDIRESTIVELMIGHNHNDIIYVNVVYQGGDVYIPFDGEHGFIKDGTVHDAENGEDYSHYMVWSFTGSDGIMESVYDIFNGSIDDEEVEKLQREMARYRVR